MFNLDLSKWRKNRKVKKTMWKNRNIDLKFLAMSCFIICFIAISLMIWNNNKQGDAKLSTDMLWLGIGIELLIMVASALISAIVTIYMVKQDIIENELMDKIQDFGIITFEDAYDKAFANEDARIHLKAESWNDFWMKSENKYICISGISMEGFFSNNKIRKQLMKLCLVYDYEIDIILANPYSEEIIMQAIGEEKVHTTDIRRRILNTYSILSSHMKQLQEEYKISKDDDDLFSKLDKEPCEVFREKFHIRFSYIMPKALIMQSGSRMIVSPYMLAGPNKQPTLIVKDAADSSFYDSYSKYLNQIKRLSCEFSDLSKGDTNEILKNRYGIAKMLTGRNYLFDEDFEKLFGVKSWKDLFSKVHEIEIIGISMYGFFTPEGLERNLIRMAADGKKITVIWANPFSEEVRLQSIAEKKEGKIKEHILLLRDMFNNHYKDLDAPKQEKVKENIQLLYSETMPKAWVVKVDDFIIYTPYFLSGPYEEPVFVLTKGDKTNNFIYTRLNNYIEQLKKGSVKYDQLIDNEKEKKTDVGKNDAYSLDI